MISKWALVGLLMTLTSLDTVPTTPLPDTGYAERVPVLLYHHLQPEADGSNGAIISVTEFEQQMAYLFQNGYKTITTAELAAWLEGDIDLPEKSVLITFDDGYRSNYSYAYPILRRYGQRAVIFMVSGWAGQSIGALDYLSWEELRTMQDSGVWEVQSHTHDGHYQLATKPVLTQWSPQEMLADLAATRQSFADHFIRPYNSFAYPYGAYTRGAQAILAEEGVRTAFTVEHGYVTRRSSPYALPRLVVYPGIGLCQFEGLLTGAVTDCT